MFIIEKKKIIKIWYLLKVLNNCKNKIENICAFFFFLLFIILQYINLYINNNFYVLNWTDVLIKGLSLLVLTTHLKILTLFFLYTFIVYSFFHLYPFHFNIQRYFIRKNFDLFKIFWSSHKFGLNWLFFKNNNGIFF